MSPRIRPYAHHQKIQSQTVFFWGGPNSSLLEPDNALLSLLGQGEFPEVFMSRAFASQTQSSLAVVAWVAGMNCVDKSVTSAKMAA